MEDLRHIFIIGAKSLGAYGGYETFVNKLTEYHQDHPMIRYHVFCKANGYGRMNEKVLSGVTDPVIRKGKVAEFTYHNARCIKVTVPKKLGPAQAIVYDLKCLAQCCRYIEEQGIQRPIVYILSCRVGPVIGYYYRKIHSLGGQLFLNPDGHEWLRGKWSRPVKAYWKYSEARMVKYSDLVVCDSQAIEKYIHESYDHKWKRKPKTTFIAYGAETRSSRLPEDSEKLMQWYARNGLQPGKYYLTVGRLVQENNHEIMIREFLNSGSQRALAIIANHNEKLRRTLNQKLNAEKDPRIRFLTPVYDEELLLKIRENAWGYIHGHEVGGTNPSLLESLGSTKLNLVLDVCFNREVGSDAVFYWTKEPGSLTTLIDRLDGFSEEKRTECGKQAKKRIEEAYGWQRIADCYEKIFTSE